MDFSMCEIINLITELYLPLGGYWTDEIKNNTKASYLLKEGYLSLDDEYKDKYKINSKGKDFFHPYIETMSLDFIEFMKAHQMFCSTTDIVDWYIEKYGLDDIDTANDIAEYICYNLKSYGYIASSCHSSKIGNGYQIDKII